MDFDKHFSDDGGRRIEWGRTGEDYAEYRTNYPADFYQSLLDRGIGVPGQTILDLGTGVGFLAQQFAQQGADVTGIDVDAGQLNVAQRRARDAGLFIKYCVALPRRRICRTPALKSPPLANVGDISIMKRRPAR